MMFKSDDYVRVIADGRIGRAEVYEDDDEIEVWFLVNNDMDFFHAEDLELVEPWTLTAEDERALVRLEKLPSALIPEGAFRDNLRTEGYQLNIADLLQGYERIASGSIPPKELSDWSLMLIHISGIECDDSAFWGEVNETNALQYALEELWNIPDDADEEYHLPEDFLADLRMLLGELDKPHDDRDLPMSWKCRIAQYFDEDSIDKQTDRIQKLFYEGLEAMCALNDPKALRKKGYCMYQGTKLYPQDWPACRDIFLKHYELTGSAGTANTLGYIFYYGRANNGVPEYEQAFRFFSIGHARGLYESSYKLADMFAHGYGVVKNPEIAFRLYDSVYEDSRPRFCQGEHTKFADAALRMGNCFSQGIGVPVDHKTAYGYYLQADLALRMRSQEGYFGDSSVAANLRRALEQEKHFYNAPRTKLGDISPFALASGSLQQHRQLKMKWKQLEDGTWKISVKPTRYHYVRSKMLITLPECDYCALVKKLVFIADASAEFTRGNGRKGVVFDSVSYQTEENDREVFRLYLGSDKCCEIRAEHFIPVLPEPKKPAIAEGQPVFMVSIRFAESGRCYDYVSEDTTLQPGDLVIVNSYDGPNVVPVVSCGMVQPSELALPIERYKKIVGRAE